MTLYRTLIADPPWQYRNAGGNGAAENHYPTMSIGDICSMEPFGRPVRELVAPDAVLYLWATWPMLVEAQQVINAWGFTYKTGLPWVKTNTPLAPDLWGDLQWRPAMGTGFWVRGCSELLLIATRGLPPVPDDRPLGLLVDLRQEHSRKPAAQYELAERHPGPYLELFARPPVRTGWDAWGNEVTA